MYMYLMQGTFIYAMLLVLVLQLIRACDVCMSPTNVLIRLDMQHPIFDSMIDTYMYIPALMATIMYRFLIQSLRLVHSAIMLNKLPSAMHPYIYEWVELHTSLILALHMYVCHYIETESRKKRNREPRALAGL